jgi:hypothetical protein
VRRDYTEKPRHCFVDIKMRLTNYNCDCTNWIQLDFLMAGFWLSKKQGIY